MSIMEEKKSSQFARYTDPTGHLSNKQLMFGQWYVRHKLLFRRILIGFLVLWCVITIGYSLIAWGSYVFSGLWQDKKNAKTLVESFDDPASRRQNYSAQELQLGSTYTFSLPNGKTDYITQAKNSNDRFVAFVSYTYEVSGKKTATQQTIILPGREQYLALYGYSSEEGTGSSGTLIIEKVNWQRISTKDVPDIENYVQSRLRFSAQNVKIENLTQGQASQVQFDILNDTSYSYWEVPLSVELLSAGQTIGIVPVTVSQWKSGEKRTISFSPVIDPSGVDDVRITPLLDIFDRSVYMTP